MRLLLVMVMVEGFSLTNSPSACCARFAAARPDRREDIVFCFDFVRGVSFVSSVGSPRRCGVCYGSTVVGLRGSSHGGRREDADFPTFKGELKLKLANAIALANGCSDQTVIGQTFRAVRGRAESQKVHA